MPIIRKLTGRNAIDMGFRRPPPTIHSTPTDVVQGPADQPKAVVVMTPAKKRIHKFQPPLSR